MRSAEWGKASLHSAFRTLHSTLFFILFCLTVGAFAQSRPHVSVRPYTDTSRAVLLLVDGKVIQAESLQIVRGQQVMVWLRDLEALGWGEAHPAAGGEVVFEGKGVRLSFIRRQGVAKVNSLAVQLPVDTYLSDGRLMVPLTFVAKALGYDCEVSYRAVATVTTAPARAPSMTSNSLHGRVTYAGKGLGDIAVRAVDLNFNTIDGALTTTDQYGDYTIQNLPDGSYMAYVYVADNPSYFNRTSEPVAVFRGQVGELKPIALWHILSPLKPNVGSKASPVAGSIQFEWTPCDEASSYELVVFKQLTKSIVARITTTEPTAQIPAAKLKAGDTYAAEVVVLDALGARLGATAGTGAKPWTFTVRGSGAKAKVRVRR